MCPHSAWKASRHQRASEDACYKCRAIQWRVISWHGNVAIGEGVVVSDHINIVLVFALLDTVSFLSKQCFPHVGADEQEEVEQLRLSLAGFLPRKHELKEARAYIMAQIAKLAIKLCDGLRAALAHEHSLRE